MKSLLNELWESFRRCHGTVVSIGGFLLSILALFVLPSTAISIKVVLPCVIFAVFLVAILIDLSFRAHALAAPKNPKALVGRPSQFGGFALVLFEPHPSFYIEQIVTLLANDEQFEVQKGVGYVLNIQSNGRIQVEIIRNVAPEKGYWKTIVNNDASAIKNLILKASIPKSLNDRLHETNLDSQDK